MDRLTFREMFEGESEGQHPLTPHLTKEMAFLHLSGGSPPFQTISNDLP
jgi:hypothetical protein